MQDHAVAEHYNTDHMHHYIHQENVWILAKLQNVNKCKNTTPIWPVFPLQHYVLLVLHVYKLAKKGSENIDIDILVSGLFFKKTCLIELIPKKEPCL